MTLTPQHVTQLLDIDDVACLLAGLDPAEVEAGLYHDVDLLHIPCWKKLMVQAVFDGDLVADNGSFIILCKEEGLIFPNNDSKPVLYSPRHHEAFDLFRREDVYHWLRSAGRSDEDVPEALRIMTVSEGRQDQRVKSSHLLAIAALVELLVKGERQRYNQNSIIDGITDNPENAKVSGLSRSNLEKLFSQAKKQLEEARKRC